MSNCRGLSKNGASTCLNNVPLLDAFLHTLCDDFDVETLQHKSEECLPHDAPAAMLKDRNLLNKGTRKSCCAGSRNSDSSWWGYLIVVLFLGFQSGHFMPNKMIVEKQKVTPAARGTSSSVARGNDHLRAFRDSAKDNLHFTRTARYVRKSFGFRANAFASGMVDNRVRCATSMLTWVRQQMRGFRDDSDLGAPRRTSGSSRITTKSGAWT